MVVVVSISDQRNTEWLVCPSSLFMIIKYLDFWQIESFKTWLVSSTEELSPTCTCIFRSCQKYSKCWEITLTTSRPIFGSSCMLHIPTEGNDRSQRFGAWQNPDYRFDSGRYRVWMFENCSCAVSVSLFVITRKLLTNCGMFNTRAFNYYMFETNAYQINKHF